MTVAVAPDHSEVVFRVLAGPRMGQGVSISQGADVSIGYEYSKDIVIRTPDMNGVELRLRLGIEFGTIHVERGAVTLLGQVLSAPTTAVVPPYLPVVVQDTAFAFGEDGHDRWSDAAKILAACRAASAEPVGSVRDISLEAPRWRQQLRTVVPALAAGLVVVALGAVAWSWLSAIPRQKPVDTPAAVRGWLNSAGFAALTVETRPDGKLAIRGLLPHDSDRVRFLAAARAGGVTASASVQSMDDVSRLVVDRFRAANVEVSVRPNGLGAVVVSPSNAPISTLKGLRSEALAQIPYLKALDFAGEGVSPALGPISGGDPSKMVTVMSMEAGGYLSTADGSKYFIGGVLPDGRTIIAISEHGIDLTKGGARSRLSF